MSDPKDPEAERDTLPPGPPDPVLAICMRLEEKVDKLIGMQSAFFERLQATETQVAAHRETLADLKNLTAGLRRY